VESRLRLPSEDIDLALSIRLREVGQLFILPAVLIPAWLLAIAGFSTIGLLPLGTLVVAVISIVFIRSLHKKHSENTLLAEVGSKLIRYCVVMIIVSSLFLVLQVGIYLFLNQYSPALGTIVTWYNGLEAKPIIGYVETLTFKIRFLIIIAILCSLIFFPLLSPQAVRVSKLASKTIDVVGALLVSFLLFAFYGSSASGLNAARIELRSLEEAVPVGNLRSKILMVQSAQNRHRQRATDGLNGTRDRRVLVQR
jgi:hypothetical protein